MKLDYKGYRAIIKYNEEDQILVGEVLDIIDSLNFHASSLLEAEQIFKQSIDNYFDLCQEIGKEPEKAKGVNDHEKLL